jgi:hypothetical protein
VFGLWVVRGVLAFTGGSAPAPGGMAEAWADRLLFYFVLTSVYPCLCGMKLKYDL